MPRSIIVQKVYSARKNTFDLVFKSRDLEAATLTPLVFTAVSRMVLTIMAPTPVQIDQATTAGTYIDWSDAAAEGRVRFRLGAHPSLPAPGRYPVRLSAVDGSGNITELIHDDMSDVEVYIDVEAVSALP